VNGLGPVGRECVDSGEGYVAACARWSGAAGCTKRTGDAARRV